MFSTLLKRNFYFSSTFILWSANAFNLDQSKILSFGQELTITELFGIAVAITHSIDIIPLPNYLLLPSNRIIPFLNKPWFLCVCSTSLLKTLWEKEKLLVKSTLYFSLQCFVLVRRTLFHFHRI